MKKILLVDDDPVLTRMYQKKLENDGYLVETAADGDTALDKIHSSRPDLVLLDIMMPRLNGFEVLKQLKAHTETSTIPVVLLSNLSSSDEDILKGIQLGALTYLIKAGNRPSVVVAKVKEILASHICPIPPNSLTT